MESMKELQKEFSTWFNEPSADSSALQIITCHRLRASFSSLSCPRILQARRARHQAKLALLESCEINRCLEEPAPVFGEPLPVLIVTGLVLRIAARLKQNAGLVQSHFGNGVPPASPYG